MSNPERPFITCHVLDQSKGKPAVGVTVTLQLVSPANGSTEVTHFLSKTNDNGRIGHWRANNSGETLAPQALVIKLQQESRIPDDGRLQWKLVFATEEYLGKGNTFYPDVEINFYTDVAETHFHVPLLLGPWGYTTYRGS
ncbi:putative HIUase/transthyretin family protein [Elsinoe australis]|uniref:5-hydroxyisourate hydrolase n=1 Tax=Elsinoe australis TaxID=40998 RepID=A0A4U7ARK1_9PEZI|nr:putative HIUase/transthyretin family protein [Elsinoe australis]